MKRQYTVKEIDELRQACEDRWLWGTTKYRNRCGFSKGHTELEKVTAVEELVRTYIMAGITADLIYKEDDPDYSKPILIKDALRIINEKILK